MPGRAGRAPLGGVIGQRAEQGAADAPAGEGWRHAALGRVVVPGLLGREQDDGGGAALRQRVERPLGIVRGTAISTGPAASVSAPAPAVCRCGAAGQSSVMPRSRTMRSPRVRAVAIAVRVSAMPPDSGRRPGRTR